MEGIHSNQQPGFDLSNLDPDVQAGMETFGQRFGTLLDSPT